MKNTLIPTVVVTGLYVLIVGASAALMITPLIAILAFGFFSFLNWILSGS